MAAKHVFIKKAVKSTFENRILTKLESISRIDIHLIGI